jgi:hypothetical protein
MRAMISIILMLSAGCSKSDSPSAGAIGSTTYYIETTDLDLSSLDITMILYTDGTFKLYATRGIGLTYNYYSGSFTSSSVTVASKTCSGTAAVTMKGITEGIGSAAMLFDATDGSSSNLTSTFSATKPSGFLDFTSATESCHANGMF